MLAADIGQGLSLAWSLTSSAVTAAFSFGQCASRATRALLPVSTTSMDIPIA
jgi:hypothetical protein